MGAKPIIDRRRHRVYVTRNTEYHTRDNRCVGVRDRRSGLWIWQHQALWARVLGGISFRHGGVRPSPGIPDVGQSLYLHPGRGDDIVTSTLTAIDRPERCVVETYPAFAAAVA
ncbi:MAG: hypothetical protein QME96_00520 [Myxococcota bacterium]|nr:hypothetical protein [Myxococcota bacterium]